MIRRPSATRGVSDALSCEPLGVLETPKVRPGREWEGYDVG
jgi:hypothetical protein